MLLLVLWSLVLSDEQYTSYISIASFHASPARFGWIDGVNPDILDMVDDGKHLNPNEINPGISIKHNNTGLKFGIYHNSEYQISGYVGGDYPLSKRNGLSVIFASGYKGGIKIIPSLYHQFDNGFRLDATGYITDVDIGDTETTSHKSSKYLEVDFALQYKFITF